MMPSSAAFSSCPSSRNLSGHGPTVPGSGDSDLQRVSSKKGVGVREEHPVVPVFEICVYVTCICMCLDIDTHIYIIYTYILHIYLGLELFVRDLKHVRHLFSSLISKMKPGLGFSQLCHDQTVDREAMCSLK